MNVRAWSVSLLLFLSTVTAVGQTVNRYLNTPLPKEWEESGTVFQQTLPVDDHFDCFGSRPKLLRSNGY